MDGDAFDGLGPDVPNALVPRPEEADSSRQFDSHILVKKGNYAYGVFGTEVDATFKGLMRMARRIDQFIHPT